MRLTQLLLQLGTFGIIVFLLVIAVKTRRVTSELVGNLLRITAAQRDQINALEQRVTDLERAKAQ